MRVSKGCGQAADVTDSGDYLLDMKVTGHGDAAAREERGVDVGSDVGLHVAPFQFPDLEAGGGDGGRRSVDTGAAGNGYFVADGPGVKDVHRDGDFELEGFDFEFIDVRSGTLEDIIDHPRRSLQNMAHNFRWPWRRITRVGRRFA